MGNGGVPYWGTLPRVRGRESVAVVGDPCAGAALPDYSVACRWCGSEGGGAQEAANGYLYHKACIKARRVWGRPDHLEPLRLPPVAELPHNWRANVRLLLDELRDAHLPRRQHKDIPWT